MWYAKAFINYSIHSSHKTYACGTLKAFINYCIRTSHKTYACGTLKAFINYFIRPRSSNVWMHIHFIYLGTQTQSYMDCNVFEYVKNRMYFSHIFEPAVTHTPYIQRSILKRIRSYAYSHRLLYKWIMHGKSHFITPDHQHSTKLKQIDIFGDNNRVNSSNFNATILKLSENSTIYFCMCLYLVTCSLGVTVSLLCRSQGRTISSPFTN